MVDLKIQGLTTGYSEDEVLKNVSLNMGKGDFTGIIGPNGSGKSTLIRASTGIIEAWSGKISLDGKSIESMKRRQIAKKTAVVPQDTFISFPYSAWEVVVMGRTPYLGRFENPGKKDKSLAKNAMRATGTFKFKDSSVQELSGGELQRVVVARALTQEPDLLLLDEATSHLDIGHKKEIMDTIKAKNQEEKLGVISVHHNLNLAARYCENILLLDEGDIHAYGTPEEVLTSSNLRAVYGVEAEVHEHPKDGSLYVSPVDESWSKGGEEKRIHVVCGGDSSGALLRELIEEGYKVSAGVLNVMDSDYEKAEFLDIECVTEAPFSNISEDSYENNLKLIKQSDLVILTDFPVGEGNVRNLEGVLEGIDGSKECLMIDGQNVEKRDYTENGKGARLYRKLLNRDNTRTFKSLEELKRAL